MRVLIISPHFPPTNAADMQRVRLLLPHFAAAGINVEVLAVEPEQIAAPIDLWLVDGLPKDVPVHRVRALGLKWCGVPGLGTLSLRAISALRKKGFDLLKDGRRGKCSGSEKRSKFDLIYFSTTQFGIHVLGPEWRRRFGVPFVMDYQDPWVNDYYQDHPNVMPPGGPLKYAIASFLSRRMEPHVLKFCSGITSVSASYPRQLATRYVRSRPTTDNRDTNIDEPSVKSSSRLHHRGSISISKLTNRPIPYLVIPFPGDTLDLRRVIESSVEQHVFDPNDGFQHWVYIGRGGEDMHSALRGLFTCVREMLNDHDLPIQMHFIGTSYAAAGDGKKTIEPLADEYGLGHLVSEHPDRIAYSQTLRCLVDAHTLLVLGSDDPAYTASKIFPYLLAKKRLLAIFHTKSSVVELIERVGGGVVLKFDSRGRPDTIARQFFDMALTSEGEIRKVDLDEQKFAKFLASEQAKQLQGFFSHCLRAFKSNEPLNELF